jgi:mersacidin/lichenicidin family type 2 lantibiotic
MSTPDIIRGWKVEDYRHSLSHEQRALLPAHPAGVIELSDEELDEAGGGFTTTLITVFCRTAIFVGEDLCVPAV